MVDLGCEGDLRRLEGIVRGKVYGEEEHSALEGTVRWSHDGGLQILTDQLLVPGDLLQPHLPVEQVLSDRSCRALGGWVPAQVLQLLVDPF